MPHKVKAEDIVLMYLDMSGEERYRLKVVASIMTPKWDEYRELGPLDLNEQILWHCFKLAILSSGSV